MNLCILKRMALNMFNKVKGPLAMLWVVQMLISFVSILLLTILGGPTNHLDKAWIVYTAATIGYIEIVCGILFWFYVEYKEAKKECK